MLGLADKSKLIHLLNYVFTGDEKGAVELLRELIDSGLDAKNFLNDFLELIYLFGRRINLGAIEKDTLITGVEFNQKMAKIHTITPKGLPLISEYPVLNYRSFAINHKGEIAFKKRKHPKRKKLLRILSHTAAFACGVWLAGKK